jgi:hypothetical protein
MTYDLLPQSTQETGKTSPYLLLHKPIEHWKQLPKPTFSELWKLISYYLRRVSSRKKMQ